MFNIGSYGFENLHASGNITADDLEQFKTNKDGSESTPRKGHTNNYRGQPGQPALNSNGLFDKEKPKKKSYRNVLFKRKKSANPNYDSDWVQEFTAPTPSPVKLKYSTRNNQNFKSNSNFNLEGSPLKQRSLNRHGGFTVQGVGEFLNGDSDNLDSDNNNDDNLGNSGYNEAYYRGEYDPNDANNNFARKTVTVNFSDHDNSAKDSENTQSNSQHSGMSKNTNTSRFSSSFKHKFEVTVPIDRINPNFDDDNVVKTKSSKSQSKRKRSTDRDDHDGSMTNQSQDSDDSDTQIDISRRPSNGGLRRAGAKRHQHNTSINNSTHSHKFNSHQALSSLSRPVAAEPRPCNQSINQNLHSFGPDSDQMIYNYNSQYNLNSLNSIIPIHSSSQNNQIIMNPDPHGFGPPLSSMTEGHHFAAIKPAGAAGPGTGHRLSLASSLANTMGHTNLTPREYEDTIKQGSGWVQPGFGGSHMKDNQTTPGSPQERGLGQQQGLEGVRKNVHLMSGGGGNKNDVQLQGTNNDSMSAAFAEIKKDLNLDKNGNSQQAQDAGGQGSGGWGFKNPLKKVFGGGNKDQSIPQIKINNNDTNTINQSISFASMGISSSFNRNTNDIDQSIQSPVPSGSPRFQLDGEEDMLEQQRVQKEKSKSIKLQKKQDMLNASGGPGFQYGPGQNKDALTVQDAVSKAQSKKPVGFGKGLVEQFVGKQSGFSHENDNLKSGMLSQFKKKVFGTESSSVQGGAARQSSHHVKKSQSLNNKTQQSQNQSQQQQQSSNNESWQQQKNLSLNSPRQRNIGKFLTEAMKQAGVGDPRQMSPRNRNELFQQQMNNEEGRKNVMNKIQSALTDKMKVQMINTKKPMRSNKGNLEARYMDEEEEEIDIGNMGSLRSMRSDSDEGFLGDLSENMKGRKDKFNMGDDDSLQQAQAQAFPNHIQAQGQVKPQSVVQSIDFNISDEDEENQYNNSYNQDSLSPDKNQSNNNISRSKKLNLRNAIAQSFKMPVKAFKNTVHTKLFSGLRNKGGSSAPQNGDQAAKKKRASMAFLQSMKGSQGGPKIQYKNDKKEVTDLERFQMAKSHTLHFDGQEKGGELSQVVNALRRRESVVNQALTKMTIFLGEPTEHTHDTYKSAKDDYYGLDRKYLLTVYKLTNEHRFAVPKIDAQGNEIKERDVGRAGMLNVGSLTDGSGGGGGVLSLGDKCITDSWQFIIATGLLLIAYMVMLGVQTGEVDLWENLSFDNDKQVEWWLADLIFFILFLIEMGFRYRDHKRWIVVLYRIDCFCLFVQFLDVARLVSGETRVICRALSCLRAIRLQKLFLLLRSYRLLMGVDEILEALSSILIVLLWGACLMMMLLVCFALLLVAWTKSRKEQMSDSVKENGQRPFDYFSNVLPAMLTLLRIPFQDGSWVNYVLRETLETDMIFFWSLTVCYYFASLAFMNQLLAMVITQLFEKKTEARKKLTRTESHMMEMMIDFLHSIFVNNGLVDDDGIITKADIIAGYEVKEVSDKLNGLAIFLEDTLDLFDVLDEGSGTGELLLEEFLGACLRLKGEAKAKDMYVATIAVQQLYERINVVSNEIKRATWYMYRFNLLLSKLEREMRSYNRNARPLRPGIDDPDAINAKPGPFYVPPFSSAHPSGSNWTEGVNVQMVGGIKTKYGNADTTGNVCAYLELNSGQNNQNKEGSGNNASTSDGNVINTKGKSSKRREFEMQQQEPEEVKGH